MYILRKRVKQGGFHGLFVRPICIIISNSGRPKIYCSGLKVVISGLETSRELESYFVQFYIEGFGQPQMARKRSSHHFGRDTERTINAHPQCYKIQRDEILVIVYGKSLFSHLTRHAADELVKRPLPAPIHLLTIVPQ